MVSLTLKCELGHHQPVLAQCTDNVALPVYPRDDHERGCMLYCRLQGLMRLLSRLVVSYGVRAAILR